MDEEMETGYVCVCVCGIYVNTFSFASDFRIEVWSENLTARQRTAPKLESGN